MPYLSKEDLEAINDAKSETKELKKTRKNALSIAKDKNMELTNYEKTGEKPNTHNLLGNKTTKFIFDLCHSQ